MTNKNTVLELFFLLLLRIFVIRGEHNVNFGTTLYSSSDLKRKWTDFERTELQRRILVGSLIPGTNQTPDDFGNCFLEYFALINRNIVKIDSVVERKRTMVMVADAIGSYMYAKLLPEVRLLYYEGKLKYSLVKRLHDLMKKIKYVLDTDGRGWARPLVAKYNRGQSALSSTKDVIAAMAGKPEPETVERCGGVDAGPYGLSRRLRWTEDHSDVPYFDNDTRPHSLVVPWRPRRPVLYGIRDAGCHRALFEHCGHAAANGVHVHVLHSWLDTTVLPIIEPEAVAKAVDWYPALWGVMLMTRYLQRAIATENNDDYNSSDKSNVPNSNFYAAVVLASAFICCLATILFTASCLNRCGRGLCLVFGHALCIRQSTDSIEK